MQNLIDDAPAGIEIGHECLDTMNLLLRKNISYGNSALEPVGIFSKADAEQQICNRIDDKLNRIKNEQGFEGEDEIDDILGYMILLKIARKRKPLYRVAEENIEIFS